MTKIVTRAEARLTNLVTSNRHDVITCPLAQATTRNNE